MHTVNAVLVDIKDTKAVLDRKQLAMADLAEDYEPEAVGIIRDYAVSETENFVDKVYDWRETDTAGRWADEYPCNVILGAKNKDCFLKTFAEFIKMPMEEIKKLIERFIIYNDNESYVISSDIEKLKSLDSMQTYRLKEALMLLDGEYTSSSHFWSIGHYSCRLSERDVQEVIENADRYALVIFDYHY